MKPTKKQILAALAALTGGSAVATGGYYMGKRNRFKGSSCPTPGEKILSKGKGRGQAVGSGKGPIGIPRYKKG